MPRSAQRWPRSRARIRVVSFATPGTAVPTSLRSALGGVLGHADRRAPLRAYTTGLLLPGERKSVEPMAARVDPSRVGAAHPSLHHFVAKAAWDDAALLRAVRDYALPALLERGPIRAWLVDDTGLPKKGKLSVGVARQY